MVVKNHMKAVKKNIVDCILFSHRGIHYLLPTVAFAELGVKGELYLTQNDATIFGQLHWRGFDIPLVSPDLHEKPMNSPCCKFAVLNAIYENRKITPYLSILIENHPCRIKLKPQDISWINEQEQTALYVKEGTLPKEVVIFDLQKFCSEVEKLVSHKSPYNP